MNAILATTAEVLTMSSREIADLLEARHDNVKRTIAALAEQGVIARPQIEEVQMKGGNNRTYTTQAYVFSGEKGKRDSIVVVAQLSPEFTARLVDRWIELEEAAAGQRQGWSPDNMIAAITRIGAWLTTVPGVKPGMAAAATIRMIEENTGIRIAPARLALPPAESRCTLNATALGAKLDLSARETKRRLATAGLQLRNERDEWQLTERGHDYGEALPFSRNGHASYQILWSERAADLIYAL